MSRIVVFGANGFIGRNLVKSLAKSKADKIIAFDRFSLYLRNSTSPYEEYENVETIVGDFFNRSDVAQAVDGADYVFHLVSSTTPASSDNDPYIDIDTNLRSSVELFDLCAEMHVKKVIFLSSGGAVYGDVDTDIISETIVPKPRSPYAIVKLTIENYLNYFKYVNGLDYVVYRVANPYGSGQNIKGLQGVIPIFLHRVLTNEPITIYGDGNMVRDYIYIEDLVEMIVGSYKEKNKERIYNLGSGRGTSINQIIDTIAFVTGKDIQKQFLPKPATFIERCVLDVSRFQNEFNIEPHTGLEEGIKKTIDYVKNI